MHSVEHMFATYVRNSDIGSQVVYFGPMGCQTGFYLLVRDRIAPEDVFQATLNVLERILLHEGPVFGARQKECGNYANLSLEAAKEEARRYLAVLRAKPGPDLVYPS